MEQDCKLAPNPFGQEQCRHVLRGFSIEESYINGSNKIEVRNSRTVNRDQILQNNKFHRTKIESRCEINFNRASILI
jgi:hypothetical protein